MAVNSKIGWTDHTFSPWRGCVEVAGSPACGHCYAKAMAKRNPKMLGVWGTEEQGGTRVVAAEAYWSQPIHWNGIAQAERNLWEIIHDQPGIRTLTLAADLQDTHESMSDWLINMEFRGLIHRDEKGSQRWIADTWQAPRVFCASISDAFEDWQGPMLNHKEETLRESSDSRVAWTPIHSGASPYITMQDVRNRLFDLIDKTQDLNWLVLTKRPENIEKMVPTGPVHEQFGSAAGCVSHARKNVWFGTTVENQRWADERIPLLLGAADMASKTFLSMEPLLGPVELTFVANDESPYWQDPNETEIDWVIVGCESGPHRRKTELSWVRSIRDQCKQFGVACFVKQLEIDGKVSTNIEDLPGDLQIQEFPE